MAERAVKGGGAAGAITPRCRRPTGDTAAGGRDVGESRRKPGARAAAPIPGTARPIRTTNNSPSFPNGKSTEIVPGALQAVDFLSHAIRRLRRSRRPTSAPPGRSPARRRHSLRPAVPGPGGRQDVADVRPAWGPAEAGACQGDVGDEDRRIAGPRRADGVRNRRAGQTSASVEQGADAGARPDPRL